MKPDKNIGLTDPELLELIERYFDCSLSDEEERMLRLVVADSDSRNPAIAEAKAIMGFGTIKSHRPDSITGEGPAAGDAHTTWNRIEWRRILNIAAAVMVLCLGAFFLNRVLTGHSGGDRCMAYLNGEKVTDEDRVMEVLIENISDLDEGAEEAEQLMLDDIEDLFHMVSIPNS